MEFGINFLVGKNFVNITIELGGFIKQFKIKEI
jgi:hypothetical protein